MWLPTKAFDLFRISRETTENQREELASIRAERDGLIRQLAASTANVDWLSVRLNALEAERAQLLSKVYGLNVPVPEVIRRNPATQQIQDMNSFSFDHVSDEMAEKLGIKHLLS